MRRYRGDKKAKYNSPVELTLERYYIPPSRWGKSGVRQLSALWVWTGRERVPFHLPNLVEYIRTTTITGPT
jgi:hypothetical protein